MIKEQLRRMWLLVLIGVQVVDLNGQQDTCLINFYARYHGQSISEISNDTLSFETCKAYIGNITLVNDVGDPVGSYEGYRLLNFMNDMSSPFSIVAYGEVDRIIFDIGTDSLVNVSGAMDGDLDPMYGMYWTWHSGYINFKLEGFHTKSINRDQSFAFHLGGYQSPYASMRRVELKIDDQKVHDISLNLEVFLDSFDWSAAPNIMSPSSRSTEMSDVLLRIFKEE